MLRSMDFKFLLMGISILLLGSMCAPPSVFSAEDDEIPMSSEWRVPITDDLPEIIKRTGIFVGTTYSRTNFFFRDDGRKYGFEYSLLKEYEAHLNEGRSRKKLPIVMAFVPMPHDRLIPALLEGHCDIAAAGLTITPHRYVKVDFTVPYITDVKEMVVTHKDVTGLETWEDLSGREVYVRESSSYYTSLKGINYKLKARDMAPIKIVKADESLPTESILEMVNAGIMEITAADSHLASLWSGILQDIRVHEEIKLRKGGRLAWMVRKNNPKLKASLNEFIKKHKKGTLKGNIYFDRYFENPRWIKNPLTQKAKKRLAQYEDWFKKYGEKYDIDWLLLSSIAFHESEMDPSARSKAGAKGLMQVQPRMAKDKRINIKDIHLPKNNIHAGAKYLALLRDSYFSNPAMKPEAQLRFSLAAYNAGPARIGQVRRKAEKMGFDPNRWFRHCEIAALRIIGQETVRYVRNIAIYYAALKVAMSYEKQAAL
jgi:membrane-bound lytic murein transglycosylase MltF